MTLNIKNLFKKVCILGASATMALGFFSPLSNAVPPTDGSTQGIKIEETTISQSDTTLTAWVTVKNGLKYTGVAQELISQCGISNLPNNKGAELYLRAVRQGDTSATISWTRVIDENGGQNVSGITGTEAGKYDIYYYINGMGRYNDVGA